MKPGLTESLGIFECLITHSMCATLDGIEIHPVYSTFWLCYHAEVAARRAIEQFFDENENAIGGEIFIRHEAMCAVGENVRIEAKVTEVRDRKIVCSIEAFSSKGRFASGHQVQIVLSQERIDAMVQKAYN